jgi:hypothetical protein
MEELINWDEGDHFNLVSIGTHSMCLIYSGPTRSPGTPAVIIEDGSGSNSIPYAAVVRLIGLLHESMPMIVPVGDAARSRHPAQNEMPLLWR